MREGLLSPSVINGDAQGLNSWNERLVLVVIVIVAIAILLVVVIIVVIVVVIIIMGGAGTGSEAGERLPDSLVSSPGLDPSSETARHGHQRPPMPIRAFQCCENYAPYSESFQAEAIQHEQGWKWPWSCPPFASPWSRSPAALART